MTGDVETLKAYVNVRLCVTLSTCLSDCLSVSQGLAGKDLHIHTERQVVRCESTKVRKF